MGKKGEGSKQFRWNKQMERVLLEILADEVKSGNRPNNAFKISSFNRVANAIKDKFGVECSSNHVEHHLRTVRNAWLAIEQLRGKSGFGWDDNMKMVVASPSVYDEHIQMNAGHEKYLNKKIEMYDEMALIVGKDKARGTFAKSFADINLDDRSEAILEVESDPLIDGCDIEEASMERATNKRASSSSATSSQSRQHGKRSRTSRDTDQLESITTKLGEVATAISRLTEDRLDINNLYDELMKTDGFNDVFLATAFDYLVEHERLAKAFLAKNDKLRKIWLENFQKLSY